MVIVSSVATWIMNIINNRMTFRTVQDIRAKAIRHIQVLPLSYLDSHSTGDIISRVIADTDILSDGLLLGFTQLFSGIVTIIGTLIFMFSKNYLDHSDGHCPDPAQFLCSKIHFLTFFPYVPETE